MRQFASVVVLMALMCGCGPKALTPEEDRTLLVGLPNGTEVRAEVMYRADDLLRGMMYRDSLQPDRGMLFIHGKAGKYRYWMFRVRIPLDILWLDIGKRIVEISANTPPCPGEAKNCIKYGGNFDSMYALELAGGMAEKNGLKVGDRLRF